MLQRLHPARHLVLTASLLALAQPAFAQNGQRGHDEAHADDSPELLVVGHPPTDFGLLATSATIDGDKLTPQLRGQIGETLARLPGVSASSFSPGASRPVLRGFDGDRIRVLTDGIGAIDASSVSADHAVVFDALTVDHIDVVHGPAVLLFGGQAIGVLQEDLGAGGDGPERVDDGDDQQHDAESDGPNGAIGALIG